MDVIELNLQDKDKQNQILQILNGFVISPEKLSKLKSTFESELELGLKGSLKCSSLQMENTYIPEFINGQEEGSYLALDLGSTNFRVMLLELAKGKIIKEIIEYYSVKDETRLGPGVELFDFLAQCIEDFVTNKIKYDDDRSHDGNPLPLGFCFSMPMKQQGLNVGILVAWTKSFNASGVEGEDVVKMLNEAITRRNNLKVNVIAILNDTTGTLVKGHYDNPQTGIGLILGTGCNGAYLEDAGKITNWQQGNKGKAKEVIIDPEFGAFGDNGCIDFVKTEADEELDLNSLLPRGYTFEKKVAGKFLGEIVRLSLVRLNQKKLFISNQKSFQPLTVKDAFTAAMVSKIVEDKTNTKKELLKLGIIDLDDESCKIIEYVCALVSERAGLLVAVPMATFIERMHWKSHVAIAVTGSVYKYHPTMKAILEKYISKMVPNHSFHTFLSDDGSGKGAGLVAAIANRLN